ncbi:MAG: hypothetical protein RL625_625 [Gemmatimonadota bacterium]
MPRREPIGEGVGYLPRVTPSLVAIWLILLSGALWARTPSLLAVGGLAGATLVLTWALRRGHETRRRRGLATILGWALVVLTGQHQLRLIQLAEDVARQAPADVAAPGEALRAVVIAEGERLAAAAQRATRLSTDRATAFREIADLLPGEVDRAVIVAQSGRPFAWSGRLVVPLDSLRGPVGAIVTPFYVVLYVAHLEGDRLGVATTLLHGAAPALALSRPLDRALASGEAEDFAYGEVAAAAGVPGAVVLELSGRPILAARGAVPSRDARALATSERVRWRVLLLLACLALVAIAKVWHRGRGVGPRVATLAILVGVILLIPLNTFSNRSVWFDPVVYFTPVGGPFTGTAAALAMGSALALLGLLTVMRQGVRPRTRRSGVGLLVLIALIGPFILRELARGIQVPATGISISLWVAWQVPIFLSAVTVLLAGVAAGRPVVRDWIGIPRWVGPVIAIVGAVLTPVVIGGPGRLPASFPLLWIAAILALALTKRQRTLLLPVAIVAACGSVATIWSATVRDRVALAAADIRSLSASDPTGITLLERYAQQLDPRGAARTRVALLEEYTTTDLAAAARPAEVATWDRAGGLLAELRVRRAPGITAGVDRFAEEARETAAAFIREVDGEPGRHLILAVPHADGTVTTVVLAPATSLVRPDAFGALLGFATPPTVDPPYRLTLGQSPRLPMPAMTSQRWERDGTELHGDWYLPAAEAPARRIHATVDLRSLDALVMRGTLLVLLDLAILGTLWILVLVADGLLPRWWRQRRAELFGSFRFRLSGALFAAFVIPSILFGWWSFQRLRVEDAQRRDLVVRETLRGIAAAASAEELSAASVRFETPLFLYADGILASTSDPLLDALAPLGRLLPAEVALTLAEGEEPSAGALTAVGDEAVRLGYRAALAPDGTALVLAAPARLDDRLLDRQRDDLTIFLLFALSLGGLIALAASGVGARQLSLPIRALRDRTVALARGQAVPVASTTPPAEFVPVFRAFDRMTVELAENRRELMRAERVLAWGEMARQVAHEIKNPLTPIRLGVQHLRRARQDGRVDFDAVLETNTARILSEIDRLDEIARTFSRYGLAPLEDTPPVPVDLAAVARDLVALERLGASEVTWVAEIAEGAVMVAAQERALRDVLMNLLENARLAHARTVRLVVTPVGGGGAIVTVTDDGDGIDGALLPRIFEPHFSTRTSGSGLGLAVSRRLVEHWGGTISAVSEVGTGTTLTVRFADGPVRRGDA